jgi:aspartate aminotransferase-like enzyme
MILATPGPVEIPLFVRESFLEETLHHRTPEFRELFIDTLTRWKLLTKMPYGVFLASSGTGGMEAAVLNGVQRRGLVINSGKFGERWGKICASFNIPFKELKYPWDTPADPDQVAEELQKGDYDGVMIQISESSGGLRHPVEEIARRVKELRPEVLVIADGITALGVEKIDTTNIDIIVGGSQKAFMLPPGLAMLGISELGRERIGKGRGFYFNLGVELQKQQEGTTAFTPAVGHIVALNRVLKKLEEIGLENHYQFTALRHQGMVKGVEKLGLKIYPKVPAKSMVAIEVERAEELRKILKEQFQILVAGGQDQLKGRLIRINNMGFVTPDQLVYILNSLELALVQLGLKSRYTGGGVRALSKYLF